MNRQKQLCEIIAIVVITLGFIASFVHMVFAIIYHNLHSIIFSAISVLLSIVVLTFYVISYRDLFDKLFTKKHVAIMLISSIFSLTIVTFFTVAYFGLSLNYMDVYNFKEIDSHHYNYWPAFVNCGLASLWLVLLIDLTRKFCYATLQRKPSWQQRLSLGV